AFSIMDPPRRLQYCPVLVVICRRSNIGLSYGQGHASITFRFMSHTSPTGQVKAVEFATLVQFSKIVSDSQSSEAVFALLAQTVVDKCGAAHALVFGTSGAGDFVLLSSFGACSEGEVRAIPLEGV